MKTHYFYPKQQRGLVLLISLIMLIALTLGGLALFRQAGSGTLAASNMAFKKAALLASDRGLEQARNWIRTPTVSLEQASVANGYFAAWCNISVTGSMPDINTDGKEDDCRASPSLSVFDPVNYNWANSVLVTSDDGNGNEIRYVIHRLCRIPGPHGTTNSDGVPQECVTRSDGLSSGGGSEAITYGTAGLKGALRIYYRVTTRTIGPRNSLVYAQATLY